MSTLSRNYYFRTYPKGRLQNQLHKTHSWLDSFWTSWSSPDSFNLHSLQFGKTTQSRKECCEGHFQQTHNRQPNGKYLVRLPLKTLFDSKQVLGRSRPIALNRFHALERKLDHRPDFSQQYASTMKEYFGKETWSSARFYSTVCQHYSRVLRVGRKQWRATH